MVYLEKVEKGDATGRNNPDWKQLSKMILRIVSSPFAYLRI
jgi:hypothetical protein